MAGVRAHATLMPKQEQGKQVKGAGKWKAKTTCPQCNSPIAVLPEYDSQQAALKALKEDFLNNHWARVHAAIQAPELAF